MTTRILTGAYTSTYQLQAPITNLGIAASGYLEAGLTTGSTSTPFQIFNYGKISQSVYVGITAVDIVGAADVTNGSSLSTAASIVGPRFGILNESGVAGTVTNLGTIRATFAASADPRAIDLTAGGVVTNGGAANPTALIQSQDYGVVITGNVGTVTNYATITGVGGSGAIGVLLGNGGGVTNGSAEEDQALIKGTWTAISGAGTVANFATVSGGYLGVKMQGGVVTNGSSADTFAYIGGTRYVIDVVLAAGTINNFGYVSGRGNGAIPAAIYLGAGGVVTNGSASDTSAKIRGGEGVWAEGAAATVTNYGQIVGHYGGATRSIWLVAER